MEAQKTEIIEIVGHVVDLSTRHGLSGLDVEAWDHDMVYDDFIAKTVTDEKGDFQLKLSPHHFKDLFVDKKPHLFFKIYQGDKTVNCTEHSIMWRSVRAGYNEFTIELDCS